MSCARTPLLLCGPTAVGKTEIALALAERLEGEIITVDSMQVYRGMDIGTAKPTLAERQRIPHHLVDVVNVADPFDAATFLRMAETEAEQIQRRGKLPIFCGGTGLYFKVWLHGLGQTPPRDPALRAEIESTPLEDLLAELAETDPETCSRIDRQNPRRVYRAIEVIRLTGRPFSTQRSAWDAPPKPMRGVCIGLSREDADLRHRIDLRVDQMFKAGLVPETTALLAAGLAGNRIALQALGYRQVVDHLEGKLTYDQTVSLVKTKTWQYARKQMRWFKRQLPVRWVPVEPGAAWQEVLEGILRAYAVPPS